MINNQQIIKKIRACFCFLQNCNTKTYQEFLAQTHYIELNKGDFVLQQGSNCTHLALMLEGTIRVYTLAESGREITLYRIESGQSCVLTASCIQSQHLFPAFALCESAVKAIIIPSSFLQKWLAESSAWRSYVFGLFSQRMSHVICLVEEVAFSNLEQRIIKLLQCYQHKTGTNEIHITHHEIALELGTSREVVSRILMRLKNLQQLSLTRGSIILKNN